MQQVESTLHSFEQDLSIEYQNARDIEFNEPGVKQMIEAAERELAQVQPF